MMGFATFCFVATVVAAITAGCLWTSYANRARAAAGELMVAPIHQDVPTLRRSGWLNLFMTVAVLLHGAALATKLGASTAATFACLSVSVLAIPCLIWAWRRVRPLDVELRRNGLVFGGDGFEPWGAMKSRKWLDRGVNNRALTLQCQFEQRVVEFRFLADRKDQIEAVFAACAEKCVA